MTSTELVGPLPTVTFHGGPQRAPGDTPKVAYVPPRNTTDPRYARCTDHRVGCDCREAELAEAIAEWRAEYEYLKDAVFRHTHGHATRAEFYRREFVRWEGDTAVWRYVEALDGRCECTGCRIARDGGLS